MAQAVAGHELNTLVETRRDLDARAVAEMTRVAGTRAPVRSEQVNLDIIARTVDEIVLVDDEEMRAAARWLWQELGIAAELSGAAAMAALLQGRVAVAPGARICVLVCGAGGDGMD